jgi:uroporphyrinogen-III synthase
VIDGADGAPLTGRRLLLTRPDDATGMGAALVSAGAEVVFVPATRIVADEAGIAAARRRIAEADWLVLTSRRAVELVLTAEVLRRATALRYACVGEATATALASLGATATIIAEPPDQDGLLAALDAVGPVHGTRVLFPAAVGARTTLEDGLRARGAIVDRITCYASRPDPSAVRSLQSVLRAGRIDLAVFTAPSSVEAWVAAVGSIGAQAIPAASIGPRTTVALRARGIPVAVEAAPSDGKGLVASIRAWCEASPPPRTAE